MAIFQKFAEKARWKAVFTERPFWGPAFMDENICPEPLMEKFASSSDMELTRALAYYEHITERVADILSHSEDPKTVMPATSKVSLARLTELIATGDSNIMFMAARRQDLTPSQYRALRALGDDRTQKTLDKYQFAASEAPARQAPVKPSAARLQPVSPAVANTADFSQAMAS